MEPLLIKTSLVSCFSDKPDSTVVNFKFRKKKYIVEESGFYAFSNPISLVNSKKNSKLFFCNPYVVMYSPALDIIYTTRRREGMRKNFFENWVK